MKNVEVNKQMNLSEHYSLGEMTKTSVKGVNNVPPQEAIENLKRLCVWLEQLRYRYNSRYVLLANEDYNTSKNVEPILINSGYRSEAVNKAIGGVKGSNHLTGCAVDIRVNGIEQAIRYGCILLDISDEMCQDMDELLIERSPKGSYWVHFAVRPKDNRRKIRFIQT